MRCGMLWMAPLLHWVPIGSVPRWLEALSAAGNVDVLNGRLAVAVRDSFWRFLGQLHNYTTFILFRYTCKQDYCDYNRMYSYFDLQTHTHTFLVLYECVTIARPRFPLCFRWTTTTRGWTFQSGCRCFTAVERKQKTLETEELNLQSFGNRSFYERLLLQLLLFPCRKERVVLTP